jgi:serine protease inhibitor
MRPVILFSVIILTGLLCLQCSRVTEPTPPAPPDGPIQVTEAEKELIASSNRFGFTLFKKVAEADPDSNLFISPLSVSLALGMTYNGAAGDTRKAMASALELAGMTPEEINRSYRHIIDFLSSLDPAVAFSIANSIWYRKGFPISPTFVDLNQTYFDAQVRGLDFDQVWAADTINAWVDVNTNGKITRIINPPIPPYMVMFLINAIYFKGNWTLPFDTSLTRDMDFFLSGGQIVQRPFMQTDTLLDYFDNDLFQMIELPYGDGDFSMTIILPRPDHTTDDIIADMNPESWSAWIAGLTETDLQLALPKFRFRYDKKLNNMLKAMGMGIAFDGDLADFSNMVTNMGLLPGNLYIDFVQHKTFVQVDEVGTEAAAVTVVGIGVTSIGPHMMFVNRPFVVAIRERESGMILFLGKVIDPVWQN